MSATGRSDVRRADDFYATPAWCVHRLLEAVDLPGGRWLEPCAGDGAIVRAVNEHRDDVRWSGVEIRDVASIDGCDLHRGDFLAFCTDERFAVCMSNPPYKDALEFIQHAMMLAPYVVMLLRLNFLGGNLRAEFMRANVPDVHVLPNRPSFTNGGTDATEYAWFIWPPDRDRCCGLLRVLGSTPAVERLSNQRSLL